LGVISPVLRVGYWYILMTSVLGRGDFFWIANPVFPQEKLLGSSGKPTEQ
jgi:hypothetical protein